MLTPSHGRAKAGWPARTYIQQMCVDTGCSPEDLSEAMDDREGWRERVRGIRADGLTWSWWWLLTLLHSLERAAAGIGLHVKAHKTKYMCFNQGGDISTLNSSSLKLVDKFTYLGSSVSSTETDIDTRLTNAWTANESQSRTWRSDLTDKMKCNFTHAAVVSILLYGCTT